MCMPIYVSEAAPSDLRGFLVTFINANIAGGQLIAALIDGAFSTRPHGL
jgi:SP family myo-inositol transporter-like MFS transporter 13